MKIKKNILFAAIAVVVGVLLFLTFRIVYAQISPPGYIDRQIGQRGPGNQPANRMPSVSGTVRSVNGNTVILFGRQGFGANSSTASYTVDAGNAPVIKIATTTAGDVRPTTTTISVSDIVVGDTLVVMGKVNGKTISATRIFDGKFPDGRMLNGRGLRTGMSSGTQRIMRGQNQSGTNNPPKQNIFTRMFAPIVNFFGRLFKGKSS